SSSRRSWRGSSGLSTGPSPSSWPAQRSRGRDSCPRSPATPRRRERATERRMTAELGLSYHGFRTGVVRGEVHDGNALRRGGVSAHAGLFGTARDVWAL